MIGLQVLLLIFLIACAISVTFSKNILNSILIYMSFSLIMSIVWITLESPDLAITEAAVGAGVTTVLFFVTLKKIHAIDLQDSTIDEKYTDDVIKNKSEEGVENEQKKEF